MIKMVEESDLIQYVLNGGGLALALWMLSKKIDDLRSDMKEINTSLKEIVLKVIGK
jgi:hypothetical protein